MLNFNNCFYFPQFGFLVAGAASGFMVLSGAGEKALSDVFSCQLRFAEGRICKKCTSKRRNQARQPIFAPIKTGAVTDGKARRERIRRPESGRKGRLEAKKENLYIYIWIIVVIFAYK
ncbi:hypothetical protein [Alistipes putredinis]|uniref:hypothetical protein n=1 Tax=Alistipes putredinis TaxID=28117 RepID=UPI003AB3F8C1